MWINSYLHIRKLLWGGGRSRIATSTNCWVQAKVTWALEPIGNQPSEGKANSNFQKWSNMDTDHGRGKQFGSPPLPFQISSCKFLLVPRGLSSLIPLPFPGSMGISWTTFSQHQAIWSFFLLLNLWVFLQVTPWLICGWFGFLTSIIQMGANLFPIKRRDKWPQFGLRSHTSSFPLIPLLLLSASRKKSFAEKNIKIKVVCWSYNS